MEKLKRSQRSMYNRGASWSCSWAGGGPVSKVERGQYPTVTDTLKGPQEATQEEHCPQSLAHPGIQVHPGGGAQSRSQVRGRWVTGVHSYPPWALRAAAQASGGQEPFLSSHKSVAVTIEKRQEKSQAP